MWRIGSADDDNGLPGLTGTDKGFPRTLLVPGGSRAGADTWSGGEGWQAEHAMTESEDLRLERALRDRLDTVELVCEADIPAELVDAAEHALRPLIACNDFDACARRFPAMLVTFFVIRGSQLYSRNALWEQLGIHERTTDAGRSFLAALRTLGLADFAEQAAHANARRYVAPILLHGAFPANVARRLVEKLEDELRRGLIDGGEARRRLLRQQDIELRLGRPAARLLDWCPDYADDVLDAVIDHIESPSGDALRRLPRHLQEALAEDTERRQGLKRLRTPYVELIHWSGIGPEVVGVEGTSWVLHVGEQAVRLGADDRHELRPAVPASAAGAGRRVELWGGERIVFFDVHGRAVPAAGPVPAACVALLPDDWLLWSESGERIEEVVDGPELTGPWSRYRSCALALHGHRVIHAGPGGGDACPSVTRAVDARQEPALAGPLCLEAVSGDNGAPVFSAKPEIVHAGLTAEELRVRFTPLKGRPIHGFAHRVTGLESGRFSLTSVLPTGEVAIAGEIEVLGSRTRLEFAVVPDLQVVRPTSPLTPAETSLVLVSAAPGVLDADGEIPVAPHAVDVDVPAAGLPPRTIVVPVPRVLWALRSTHTATIEFADGIILADVATLIEEPPWLFVRSAVPADIGLRLVAGGVDVQTIAPRRTAASGPTEHHRSLVLAELRDTFRAHRGAHLELVLTVDGRRMPAIVCQGSAARSWRTPMDVRRDRVPDNSTLRGVPWLDDGRREPTSGSVDASDLQLLDRLHQADAPDAVVGFLRELATRHRTWLAAEFPSGQSALDWTAVNEVANELWRVDGVRLREFADQPDDRRRRWARARSETLRRAPESVRRDIEHWLLGRSPRPDQLTGWRHLDLLRGLSPNRSTIDAEWLPAAIAYHMLAVIGGDDESGPAVAEAMELEPTIVLEALAMILQLLRTGIKIHPPVVTTAHGDDGDDSPDAADEPPLPTLKSLTSRELSIAVVGRALVVATSETCAPPAVRLSVGGRAAAILATRGDGCHFEAGLPGGLRGSYDATVVDPRSVPVRVRAQVEIDVPAAEQPLVRCAARRTDLHSLSAAHHDAIVDHLGDLLDHGIVSRKLVDELFIDERAGAAALARTGRDHRDAARLERIVIACLPACTLFADLGVTDLAAIKSNRLLFAAVAPRRADRWRCIGWPNDSRFDAGRSLPEDLVGFTCRLARGVEITAPTFRYAPTTDYPNHERLDIALGVLEHHHVDPGFLDVMVATHRMLTIDALVDEATTLLLAVHRTEHAAVANAIVAGIAATLATNAL